jgi:hypothetical protein
MPISRKSVKPVGITNEQGEPEIELTVAGLKLSMHPPAPKPDEAAAAPPAADDSGDGADA